MEEQSATRRVLVAVVGVMEDARKLGERNWEECCKK